VPDQNLDFKEVAVAVSHSLEKQFSKLQEHLHGQFL
jgi:hypothetical protein